MASQQIHRAKIEEHLQVLREAAAIGLENRPATVGFHTSACAIDLLEMYLHKTGKIPIGSQIKHEWFKRPKPGQKILPLAERNIKASFQKKAEILELMYSIEENRNQLIYGHSTKSQVKHTYETFEKLKDLIERLLKDEGEEIEDTNP